MEDLDTAIIKHIETRLEYLKVQDSGRKYLEMVNCLVNLLWDMENNRNSSSQYTREWSLDKIKVRIQHGNI